MGTGQAVDRTPRAKRRVIALIDYDAVAEGIGRNVPQAAGSFRVFHFFEVAEEEESVFLDRPP